MTFIRRIPGIVFNSGTLIKTFTPSSNWRLIYCKYMIMFRPFIVFFISFFYIVAFLTLTSKRRLTGITF